MLYRRSVLARAAEALICSIVTVAITPSTSLAQQPFSTLTIGGTAVQPSRSGELDNHWDEGPGAVAYVETPFYVGQIRAGVRLASHAAKTVQVPDYDARYYTLEWRMPIEIIRRLELSGGGRLGIVQIEFDDPSAGFQQSEHEIVAGVTVQIRFAVWKGLAAHVTASADKIFLSRHVTDVYAGAGLQYTIRTPSWLREALR